MLRKDIEVFDSHGHPATAVLNAQEVHVKFRGSKNDQRGEGTLRILQRSGHKIICPVVGAIMLLHNASTIQLPSSNPLCSLSNNRVLEARTLSKTLQAVAKSKGLDPTKFSSHSLRSGGATSLLENNVDSTTIKLHGRWKSDAFQRYTRMTSSTSRSLSSTMVGQTKLKTTSSNSRTEEPATSTAKAFDIHCSH